MAKNNISEDEQWVAVMFIQETFDNYEKLSGKDREKLLNIYDWYISFTQEKQSDWSSSFKINKAHEIVNKILPRVIAKNPRWVVSPRIDEFRPEDRELTWEARKERLAEMQVMARWVQDYLTYIFDNYNLREPLRLWAKNMIIYWNAYAKIKYKYEVARIKNGKGIEEKVIWEYPTIDVKSWADIYVDPRYVLLEDMPSVIEVTNWVRLADLKRKKDKYMNLDKIEFLPDEWTFKKDANKYKQEMNAISGIPIENITGWVDKNSLTLRTYYWKYDIEWDERLYKIATIDDLVVIEFEEITIMPFEDIKAFDNTENHYSVWFVEPILSLQEELNFKKNSASEYINNALNRSWIWSPNSWINPSDLISRPNNIIVTSKDAITAQNNLIELPHRNLPTDYFQEQNDLERQIQSATHTIDTSAQKSQQGLTNTATWIRVKFFESNSVIDEVRKHFEEWLEKLAYKLLQSTYENMEDNIVIKKLWDEWYWEMNKELLKDALNRYSIKIEVNSSSFDDLENRREDAIAFGNVMLQAANSWVQVDFNEVYKDIIWTFEKRDVNKYIKETPVMQEIAWLAWEIEWTERKPNEASALTEQVAKGWITSAI